MLAAIAEMNGVAERIRIAGACGHEELRAVAASETLIVSDCEGCEMELLDLDRVPALSRCTILTETHDHLAPGATDALRARFTATHDVRELQTEPRFVGDFPELDFMPLVSQQLAISEFRSAPMRRLVLRPRD